MNTCQEKSMRHRSRPAAVAVLSVFAAGLLAASFRSVDAAQPPANAAASPAAEEFTLAYREVPDTLSAEGVVEATRQSTLAAQIAGQIVEIKIKVGDSVRAGQILVRIDPRTAEQAVSGSQSQVAEAQAGLAHARSSHDRSKQLFAQKFISKAALDQSELEYKAAQARLAALEANAGQATTAGTFTRIAAPYAGVISALQVEVGDMATPGRALVTLFDPAIMRVSATLPESLLRDVRLDMPVQVDVPATRRSLPVRRITPVPQADSRTHTTQLRLDIGDVAGLLPGQFARAHFTVGASRKLLIPARAVLRRSEVTAAYVLNAGTQPQMRQIRVGDPSPDGFVEVLAGLREGERVALAPVRAGLVSGPGTAASK